MKRISKMKITGADKLQGALNSLDRIDMDQARESLAYVDQQLKLTEQKIAKLQKKIESLRDSRSRLAVRHNELVDEAGDNNPF